MKQSTVITLELTFEEVRILRRALTIAAEDGSIYSGLDEEDFRIVAAFERQLDQLHRKLKDAVP